MSNYCCDYGCNQERNCPARATRQFSGPEMAERQRQGMRPMTEAETAERQMQAVSGMRNTGMYGAARQQELPITMDDDGFIDMVDGLIVVIRWPLLCFAVVAMLLFIVAMILHLPWAK